MKENISFEFIRFDNKLVVIYIITFLKFAIKYFAFRKKVQK